MKSKRDLVDAWLRKARSDFTALEAALEAGSFDAACFHAQQAAEKSLKAYLIHAGVEFPFTHNLTRLIRLCVGADPSFAEHEATVEPLTPYAVELRYDAEFWPDRETAEDAAGRAKRVVSAVEEKLG